MAFYDFDDEYGRTSRQPQQSQDEYYDNVNLDFYSKAWDEWNQTPGTPSSGAGRTRTPSKGGRNPLANLDDDERDAFIRVRRWGKGAVYAAAEELDLIDINDIETMDLVNDWLKENYGNLFDDEEEEEEREPFVPTVYEPKELDVGDYTPTPMISKVSSRMRIGSQPNQSNKMKITGTSGY
jgi:hypothetical protein